MGLRFTGSDEELKEKLKPLSMDGELRKLNENQFQFIHQNGGIMNWYPTTGTINFQGNPKGKILLEEMIDSCLFIDLSGAEESREPGSVPPPIIETTKSTDDISEKIESEPEPAQQFLGHKFADSEIIIGLVGAVGTELNKVSEILQKRLKVSGYSVENVNISSDIISLFKNVENKNIDEYTRISSLMDAGNDARKNSGDNSILALGATAWISSKRIKDGSNTLYTPRKAFIIKSLKHPDEVVRFREIYPEGFHLIGVYSDEKRRHLYLTEEGRMSGDQAQELILRDQDEHLKHGQKLTDTFYLSDVFVRLDGDDDHLKNSLWRFLEILFAHPYRTPTFDEFAMFQAFSASLRSADLSRQVGAVIARNEEIIATGANDCPKYGGGLYWPKFNDDNKTIEDRLDGRDYMRGEDSNKIEQKKIIDSIVESGEKNGLNKKILQEILTESRIRDLTEFGRVVHAEMEALLCCARNNISTRDATLYCTTFPCHNCAKHIIAAGIKRVVYIEPYPKSKAAEFHSDAIALGFSDSDSKNDSFLRFEPFVGIGPRRFLDLFSMQLGSGFQLIRKDKDGQAQQWDPKDARLRLQMLPCSYLDLELLAGKMFKDTLDKKGVESE